MSLSLHAILLSFIFTALGCESKGAKAPESQGLVGTAWTGSFRLKGDGGKLSDAEKIQFHFFTDLTFNLVLIDNLTKTVGGTYKDMPINKRLVLNVDKSAYEEFGKEGDTKIFSYELENDELILNDDEGEYLLSRESSEEEDEQTALEGDWYCKSNDGTKWAFNISDQEFRASKTKAEYKSVYFEGEVSVVNAAEGEEISRLQVKSSNVKELIGTVLRIQLEAEYLIVEEINKSTDEADPNSAIQCTR
jgi:hypothetical protein